MMTDWYDKTIQALQLNGKGERTQEAYARSVRMLSQFYGKTPDQISEQELQDYFLHRGKGAKDRYVPLPQSTLNLLRRYWVTHRPSSQPLAEPDKGSDMLRLPWPKVPPRRDQGAFRRAKFPAGIRKKVVAAHTL